MSDAEPPHSPLVPSYSPTPYSPTPTPEYGSPPPGRQDAAKASHGEEASSAADANNSEVNQHLAELFDEVPKEILAPKAFEPEHDIATGC